MWERAPYGALTATLKFRNAAPGNFRGQPCCYSKVPRFAVGSGAKNYKRKSQERNGGEL
jgi:hypothetical protein